MRICMCMCVCVRESVCERECVLERVRESEKVCVREREIDIHVFFYWFQNTGEIPTANFFQGAFATLAPNCKKWKVKN